MDERATTSSSIEEEIKSYISTPREKINLFKEKNAPPTADRNSTPFTLQSIKLDFFKLETSKKKEQKRGSEESNAIDIEPDSIVAFSYGTSRKHQTGR